jgi:TP901 family phage tail tape measure protein
MAETIASMAVRIGADISGFEKNMKEFNRTWGKLGKQVSQAGQQIGTAFTAAGGAIAAGLGFAVNKAMDFDAQMSRVGAISQATDSDLQALRQSALDLGASTSKSAAEVAVGMELMAAKGYDAQQIIAAMPGVIAAAEASGQDMALVADTVASALNAFGLEASQASKVADVLAMSANSSAAGVDDLQYAFKFAAPVAKSLGISLEELAAATGIMADAGMKGEQAGTTLRAALLRLVDPPKEAQNTLRDLGVSITDASGKFLPFDQIISQLRTSTEGMTNAQKAQALSTIFGTEAMTGMLTLVEKGPEKLRTLTAELQNSGGASAEAAAKMKDNLKGALEELSGAAETAQISIGDALSPALKWLADVLQGLVDGFNKLSPETKRFIAISTAVTGAIFLIVGALGFLSVALGAVATAQWAIIAPWAGIIAAVTAGIVAVIAIGALIISHWDEIKDALGAAWQWIKETAAATWDSIKQTAISVWQGISGFFVGLWEGIKQTATAVWNGIVSFFRSTWDKITGIFQSVWNVLGPIVMTGWENIKTIFRAVWQTIVMVIDEAWNFIKTIFATAFLAVYSIATGNWKLLGKTFQGFKENIVSIILNLMQGFKEIWGGAFAAIAARTEFMLTYIKTLFKFAKDKIASIASGMWEGIKQTFWDAVEAVKTTVSNMWNSVVTFFAEAPGKIAAKLAELKTQMMQKWQEIKSDALSMGENFIRGFVEGITNMAAWLYTKISEFFNKAVDWAKKVLGIASPSKVMMEIGEYTAEGLAEGIRNKTGEVESAAKDMASAVEEQVNRTKQLIDSFKPGGANFGMSQEQIDRMRFGQSAAAGGNLDLVANDEGWKSVQGAVQSEYERLIDEARRSGSTEDVGIIMDKAKANVDAILQNEPTRYHSGGLVSKLGPREVPAILEEGEVVLPRGARASGGNGLTINITGNTFYGERDLVDRVGPALIRYLAKAGVRT